MLIANIDIGYSVSANGPEDHFLFTWPSPWIYEGMPFLSFKNTRDPKITNTILVRLVTLASLCSGTVIRPLGVLRRPACCTSSPTPTLHGMVHRHVGCSKPMIGDIASLWLVR
jgi:hypothetical protein